MSGSESNLIFDYLSSSALSLVAAGNTGIAPFLTLFVLGLVEALDPELLNMGGTMERLLASPWSLAILGLLSVLELLSKCIPALDEVVDSVEVFVVPVLSVVATLATLGLLPDGSSDVDNALDPQVSGLSAQNVSTTEVFEGSDGGNAVMGGALLVATRVVLVLAGIVLSLLIHVLKMVVRVSSLLCSAGCCQPCLTILEIAVVGAGMGLALVSPVVAMVACGVLWAGAVWVVWYKFCRKPEAEEPRILNLGGANANHNTAASNNAANTASNNVDNNQATTGLHNAVSGDAETGQAGPPIVEATVIAIEDDASGIEATPQQVHPPSTAPPPPPVEGKANLQDAKVY